MVVWTEVAKVDLRNIHDFIAKDSKFYLISNMSQLKRHTRKDAGIQCQGG